MRNRLTSAISGAIRSSESSQVNDRDFHDGDLDMLVGLQLNAHSPLGNLLKVRPAISLEESGALAVSLPAFDGKRKVVYPKSSLQVKSSIRATLVLLNFREDYYQISAQCEVDIKGKNMEAIDWHFDPAIPDGCALLVFMSLQYYVDDAVQGRRNVNGERLNPVELIGAYQFWQGRPGTESLRERVSLPGYRGNEMLRIIK